MTLIFLLCNFFQYLQNTNQNPSCTFIQKKFIADAESFIPQTAISTPHSFTLTEKSAGTSNSTEYPGTSTVLVLVL